MSTTTATLDRTYAGQPFPTAGTYAIDVSHSSVQAVARHLMVSKVRGSFALFFPEVQTVTLPSHHETGPLDARIRELGPTFDLAAGRVAVAVVWQWLLAETVGDELN